jgi:hypothetical protein
LSGQGKIGSTLQRRFAKAGPKTPADGVPLWTETACRFQPKPPAGLNRNCLSETPKFANKPEDFILVIVEFEGDKHRVHYVREPFKREPDFGVTSVNYSFAELLGRADRLS